MTSSSYYATQSMRSPADFEWPVNFERIPGEDWVHQSMDQFGLNYDSFETHGWYKNLEPIIAQVLVALTENKVLIDYSSGTGILTKRLLGHINYPVGVLNVDASPKLLRIAVEKLRHDTRAAFRLLSWLPQKQRLQVLEEVAPVLQDLGVDVLTSTNAIHLYTDLDETLNSWFSLVRSGGLIFVGSGNIRNPGCRPGDWLIDETVAKVNAIAADIVRTEPAFEQYRDALEDSPRMAAHTQLREKVFVPVRPLEFYLDTFSAIGFKVLHAYDETVHVQVTDWYRALRAYHEAVLSWVGGSQKVEGQPPTDTAVRDRLFLIKYGLQKLFPTQESFPSAWTYLTCRR